MATLREYLCTTNSQHWTNRVLCTILVQCCELVIDSARNEQCKAHLCNTFMIISR
jgi:hypothetical protein